jgi:hypothetical protein
MKAFIPAGGQGNHLSEKAFDRLMARFDRSAIIKGRLKR